MNSQSQTPTSLEKESEESSTINDLLSSDPETITDDQAYKIVAFLRDRREQWERAEGEVKRRGTGRVKRRDGAGGKKVGQLKIEELDIQLDDL